MFWPVALAASWFLLCFKSIGRQVFPLLSSLLKTKTLSVTFDMWHCFYTIPLCHQGACFLLKHNFHSATAPSSLSCCLCYLWNQSRSHLPVKTSPLFVWLQQKIALCHSAFVMIVLFSSAICAQWVILTIFMFSLYYYTLQQKQWVGAMFGLL